MQRPNEIIVGQGFGYGLIAHRKSPALVANGYVTTAAYRIHIMRAHGSGKHVLWITHDVFLLTLPLHLAPPLPGVFCKRLVGTHRLTKVVFESLLGQIEFPCTVIALLFIAMKQFGQALLNVSTVIDISLTGSDSEFGVAYVI